MNLLLLDGSGHLYIVKFAIIDGSLQGRGNNISRSFFPNCIFTEIKHILMILSSPDESNPY